MIESANSTSDNNDTQLITLYENATQEFCLGVLAISLSPGGGAFFNGTVLAVFTSHEELVVAVGHNNATCEATHATEVCNHGFVVRGSFHYCGNSSVFNISHISEFTTLLCRGDVKWINFHPLSWYQKELIRNHKALDDLIHSTFGISVDLDAYERSLTITAIVLNSLVLAHIIYTVFARWRARYQRRMPRAHVQTTPVA